MRIHLRYRKGILSQGNFLHRADSPAPDSLAIPMVQVGDALVVAYGPRGRGLADYATVRRARAHEWNDGGSDSGVAGRASDRGCSGLAGSGRPQLDGPTEHQAQSSPVAADHATAGKRPCFTVRLSGHFWAGTFRRTGSSFAMSI